jgi:hypothetical protein
VTDPAHGLVVQATGAAFDAHVAGTDLVVTDEVSRDAQSLYRKAPIGVARRPPVPAYRWSRSVAGIRSGRTTLAVAGTGAAYAPNKPEPDPAFSRARRHVCSRSSPCGPARALSRPRTSTDRPKQLPFLQQPGGGVESRTNRRRPA